MVDQLLKRLGTDIVILDELPTMNRYSNYRENGSSIIAK